MRSAGCYSNDKRVMLTYDVAEPTYVSFHSRSRFDGNVNIDFNGGNEDKQAYPFPAAPSIRR